MTAQNKIFNSFPPFAFQPFVKLIEEKDKEETTSSGYKQSSKHFLKKIGDHLFSTLLLTLMRHTH